MTRRANFKQSDAVRALRAAQAVGLKPTGYKIDPNGAIVVTFGDPAPSSDGNPWDVELKP